jgi:site-specific recombinase XerD
MFGSLKTIVGVMTDAPPDDITFESVLAFQWHEMTYQWTTVAMSRIANLGLAPSTANRHLYALRGVLKECWRLGFMSQEDYARAVDLKPIIGSRLSKGRSLEAWEIRALLNDCLQRKPKPSHIRDAAMIAVLYTNGLRRAEMVNINLEDFNAETGCITVIGKRNKQRTVYVTNKARTLLDKWLDVRGDWSGRIFCPIDKYGNVVQSTLTDQAVYLMLKRRGENAGLAPFSPHDMRRSFIGDLLDAGVDISTVANMAGHDSVEVTRKYDRRGERAKRDASAKLDLPL